LCHAQGVLREALIQKAKDSGALDIGTSKLCDSAGIVTTGALGYGALASCMDLRRLEINQVYDSINNQVYAVRSLCYANNPNSSNNQNNNSSLTCPTGTTLNSLDNMCYCPSGYDWSKSSSSCLQQQKILTCPWNSNLVNNVCYCKQGYKWNESRTQCSTSMVFSDVTSLQENAQAINFLKTKGIISGNPDGSFKPLENINRAEIAKLIITAKGGSPEASAFSNCFPDVNSQWFSPYVCFAKSKNWLNGYPDGTFQPSKNVNKVEALKILLNAFDLTTDNSGTSSFYDVKPTEWYAKYVHQAQKMNVLEVVEKYSPNNAMARGKFAEYLGRVLYLKENNGTFYDHELEKL
jgi:hypothetical protein